jgi:hypothetical protein
VLQATYESNTNIAGKTLELTGTLTGRVKYYERYGDDEPTFDDVGTIKQHAKFEITAAGCKVFIYETESRVRVNYQSQADDGRDIKESVWVERSGPGTTCELE